MGLQTSFTFNLCGKEKERHICQKKATVWQKNHWPPVIVKYKLQSLATYCNYIFTLYQDKNNGKAEMIQTEIKWFCFLIVKWWIEPQVVGTKRDTKLLIFLSSTSAYIGTAVFPMAKSHHSSRFFVNVIKVQVLVQTEQTGLGWYWKKFRYSWYRGFCDSQQDEVTVRGWPGMHMPSMVTLTF